MMKTREVTRGLSRGAKGKFLNNSQSGGGSHRENTPPPAPIETSVGTSYFTSFLRFLEFPGKKVQRSGEFILQFRRRGIFPLPPPAS